MKLEEEFVDSPDVLPCNCMGVAIVRKFYDIASVQCTTCNRETDCMHDLVGKNNSAVEQAIRAWNSGYAKIWS